MYRKLDEKTIEAILESGIDVFVEKGLKGAGMNEIAKRSGVSVGVIYKYFSDKDSFFLHCVMQFSYSCDYYRERMKIFCGSTAEDEEEMAESLIRFIEGALRVQTT